MVVVVGMMTNGCATPILRHTHTHTYAHPLSWYIENVPELPLYPGSWKASADALYYAPTQGEKVCVCVCVCVV